MSTTNELIDNMTLTDTDKQTLKNAVQEFVNSQYRKQAEMDLQKDISGHMKDELGIPPKLFRKLANTVYKDSAKKENEELTAVLDLAEALGLYSHSE